LPQKRLWQRRKIRPPLRGAHDDFPAIDYRRAFAAEAGKARRPGE
jgi:hypothetical protein